MVRVTCHACNAGCQGAGAAGRRGREQLGIGSGSAMSTGGRSHVQNHGGSWEPSWGDATKIMGGTAHDSSKFRQWTGCTKLPRKLGCFLGQKKQLQVGLRVIQLSWVKGVHGLYPCSMIGQSLQATDQGFPFLELKLAISLS